MILTTDTEVNTTSKLPFVGPGGTVTTSSGRPLFSYTQKERVGPSIVVTLKLPPASLLAGRNIHPSTGGLIFEVAQTLFVVPSMSWNSGMREIKRRKC